MAVQKLGAARNGATAIEYALLIGMIGLLAMEAMQLTGFGIQATMGDVGAAMPTDGSIAAPGQIQ